MSPERLRRVAELAEGWVRGGDTPALAVLVARRGVIVLHEAFGRLSQAPDAPPVQLDSIFALGSVTKPITATAVMILVEDGLLGLNRPVSDYLPGFESGGKEAVMVHQLLTHTSGFNEPELMHYKLKQEGRSGEPSFETYFGAGIDEFLRLQAGAPLWKPPGAEMSYSSYAYELLGEIVRRVSSVPLAEFAQRRIFEPLGMADSYYIVPDSLSRRIVQIPAGSRWKLFNTRAFQLEPWACGGAFSTARDMAVFGQMFLNGGAYSGARILSPVTVREMTRNQIPGISATFNGEFFPEASWGYGWNVKGDKKALRGGSLTSPRMFNHGGAGGSVLWVDPVCELVGVYFSRDTWATGSVESPHWRGDYFANAVTASVIEE